MGIFALDRDKDGGLRVKSPHAPIGATLPPPERIVKGQTPPKPVRMGVEEARRPEVSMDVKSMLM